VPVVISERFGIPVRPAETGAPVLTVAENGFAPPLPSLKPARHSWWKACQNLSQKRIDPMANTKRLIELGMPPELAKEVAAQIDAAAATPDAVSSVNGQTGVVELDAEDVGAVATPDTPA